MVIKNYEMLVLKRLKFIYGRDFEKKIKERKFLYICLPILAVIGFLSAVFAGFEVKNSAAVIGLLLILIVVANEYGIYSKAKKKKQIMRFELSEITDRLAILLEAGVGLWNAFSVLAENSDKKRPLEAEIRQTVAAYKTDTGYFFEPEKAFEELAERCDDASISTFVSIIVQNSRKGGNELATLLRIQAVNQRTERRAIAKQLADEASTLMVIPSALVLAAIMVLVAAPAVISFF